MTVAAIIVAAGVGRRMGQSVNKQYLLLNGRPVLGHTIQAFEQCREVDDIVVVVRSEEMDYCRREIVDRYAFGKVCGVEPGGDRRQDSVFSGLRFLKHRATPPKIVVVHDGARPLVETSLIRDVIEMAARSGAAISAVPVKDTIKTVANGMVTSTLERSQLWAVQTPQAFSFEGLWKGHIHAQECSIEATDDSALLEAIGFPVAVVTGSERNIKITTPADLVAAEGFLKGM